MKVIKGKVRTGEDRSAESVEKDKGKEEEEEGKVMGGARKRETV